MFRMAIGAEKPALACFFKDFRPAQVRERAHVELKQFLLRNGVMKLERRMVATIVADRAASS
jgi:hypothetical protein